MTSIDVDSDNEYFKSETGILFNKEGTCILCYPANKEGNNYSIPNKVTVIGNCAFGSCSNLSSVNLHDNITIIGDNAFELCSSLTSITIPSSVTSIGSSTFYECNELTSVISKITVPFEINDYAFSNYSKPTPNGTKEVYQATNGWKNFVNIVEAGLTPMENEDEIDYGEDGNVDENTDLEGTIIDNVFYNIAPENGGFDAEEKCIVVNKSMSDEEIESVFGKDLQSDEVKQTFAGLVIEVPAGKGSVKINADATGGMTLKVKIGSADPVTMEFDGRLTVTVPYNVIEPTYVYIYAGESGAASRRRSGDESEKSLSIYGLGIASKDLLKGDVNDDESVDVQDVVGVVDYILQRPAEGFGLAAGDVNGDKQINVVDVVGVVDIILGRTNSARRRQSMIDEEHSIDLLSLTRHDDGGFSLDLLNTGRYVATQFDVHLSDGQRLEDVRLNGKRFSGHSLSYTEVAENTYRVLVYSMGNNAIVGQAGELLNFRIAGSEGGFTVDNILFITPDQGIRYFEAMNSLATGIMLIDNGQWTMDNEPADVYSTDGRLVRKSAVSLDGLPKGVYVINGRKVIK